MDTYRTTSSRSQAQKIEPRAQVFARSCMFDRNCLCPQIGDPLGNASPRNGTRQWHEEASGIIQPILNLSMHGEGLVPMLASGKKAMLRCMVSGFGCEHNIVWRGDTTGVAYFFTWQDKNKSDYFALFFKITWH